MNIKLGYAVDNISKDSGDLLSKLERIAKQQTDAIELSLTREEKFQQKFTSEITSLLRKFKYRSIHAPVVDSKLAPVQYPSKKVEPLLKIIDKLISDIDPQVVLFHPDRVGDFGWLNNKYGSLLAFENMDKSKEFGKTVKDMKLVFEKSPKAKWVFDINHIYTNDNSMESANSFYDAFKDRLCHYHVSGFGGFHDCFYRTHEDIILTAITDLTKPMIHEGHALEKGLLKKESDYIRERLTVGQPVF